MSTHTRYSRALIVIQCFIAGQIGFAQAPPVPPRILAIVLRNAPNDREPINEPNRIRIDDRAPVTIRLMNISPLDVCSLGARTQSPTVEVNPFESLVSTIAGLGGPGFGVGGLAPLVALHAPFALATGGFFDDPVYVAF